MVSIKMPVNTIDAEHHPHEYETIAGFTDGFILTSPAPA